MHNRKHPIVFWMMVAGVSWAIKVYPHWEPGLIVVLAIGIGAGLITGHAIARFLDMRFACRVGKCSENVFTLLFISSGIGMIYMSSVLGFSAGLGWALYLGACLQASLLIAFWIESIVRRTWPDPSFGVLGTASVTAEFTQTSAVHMAYEPLTDKTLDDLVGLASVKREVARTLAIAKTQRARKKKRLKTPPYSFHAVLTGNPGTGKTTLARVYGKILRDAGILKKGHFVEADRSDLVGVYLGETAQKVKAKVREAIGGVLFIDEAYALAGTGRGDHYATEAIDTLVPLIEEHRDELVVMLAGYEQEMRELISSNPGLRSRFKTFLHFEDYTPAELTQIFEGICRSNDYVLDEDARRAVAQTFSTAYEQRGRDFGNGRLARNLFEMAIAEQAIRLGDMRADKKTLSLLTGTDIAAIELAG